MDTQGEIQREKRKREEEREKERTKGVREVNGGETAVSRRKAKIDEEASGKKEWMREKSSWKPRA